MATFPWRSFLEQYSRELLADRSLRERISEDVRQSGWMGFEPAPSEQIRELEARLGTQLPESYKQFLATSNGWRESGGFIYDVWPTSKVEWFRINNQEWIDAYVEPGKGMPPVSIDDHCDYSENQNNCKFRVGFLQSTLLISDVGDSAVYLLNPEIKTQDGEWEAWFFATWSPGAARYRSFWDLMQAESLSFVRLRDHREHRYFPEDGVETLPRKLQWLIKDLVEKANGHRSGQQVRAARGDSIRDEYTDGVIEALEGVASTVKRLGTQELPADELLSQLTDLAAGVEDQWKAHRRPNKCGSNARDGRAEGNREAAAIIWWFLNRQTS